MLLSAAHVLLQLRPRLLLMTPRLLLMRLPLITVYYGPGHD